MHIASDGGRVCRPLLIVDPATGRPKLTDAHIADMEKVGVFLPLGLQYLTVSDLVQNLCDLKSLLAEGIVEYVDVNEENNCLVALVRSLRVVRYVNVSTLVMFRETRIYGRAAGVGKGILTWRCVNVNRLGVGQVVMRISLLLQVDPMTILGVVTGLIPYPHHNQASPSAATFCWQLTNNNQPLLLLLQSPRNTYQCAMGKQAMGTIARNQYERIDTVLYLLSTPQARTHPLSPFW